MKEKVFICAIILIAFFYQGFAQATTQVKQANVAATCKIKGRLIDSVTGQPVSYATVVAFRGTTDSVAGGSLTDDKGLFSIDHLPGGVYRVKIEFIGYNPIVKTSIILTGKKPVSALGSIKLAGASRVLRGVSVTGAKNFMENHLDKLVYNVANDISSQGGVATDVLKKIPMVSVDIDGNIDLLGDPNVRVFINGKPSSMFDNNLAAALAAIPASQIKSIEVITSPGAQYDAQGTGGIINIILKDNKVKGTSGYSSLSGGSRYENGYIGMHIKNGNLDINASAGGNMQLNTKTLTSYSRAADSEGLDQDGYNTLQRKGYWGHTGFDWAITKTDNFDAGISYNNFDNTNQGVVTQDQITDFPIPVDTLTTRNSNSYFRYKGEDWNANYKKKFGREGQEINVRYLGSVYGSASTYGQTQFYTQNDSEFTGAKGNNYYTDNENSITAYYTRPFSKNTELNVGLKGTFSSVKSSADYYTLLLPQGSYVVDPEQDDNFNFRRNIYAAYASFSCNIAEKYDLKLGVRDEYTTTRFPADTLSIPANNFISPSATLSRKLANNQTIKLAYSRRIQRPGFGQYNPFVNAADPANLTTGNPYLQPQKMHAIELSYYKFYDQGSNILVTLYYRYSGGDWQSYSSYYTAYQVGDSIYRNTTVGNTVNAAKEQTGGANISGTWAATKKLQARCNINTFDKYLVSLLPGGAITNNLNFRASLNVTYKFTKSLSGEFYSGYNSPRYEVQGKYPSFASYSIALRQQLLKTKANISISATDPFNKYTNQTTYINQTTAIPADNFTSVSARRYPYRYFSLSFSYRFGKIEFKENKKEDDENENPPVENNTDEGK